MNLYEQQIEKLRKALQEGCKEATDYLAEGPDDADVQVRLQIARNTAARATDVVVAARCAGRASVFETYLGELDAGEQRSAEALSAEGGLEPDALECSSCGENCPRGECEKSKRPCGHHCNHSWSHDGCCWCGIEFRGETPMPEPKPSTGDLIPIVVIQGRYSGNLAVYLAEQRVAGTKPLGGGKTLFEGVADREVLRKVMAEPIVAASAARGEAPIAGLVAGLWYGRPEAPNKPGKISIDVTSDEDRLPLLALGDVVELRKIEGSAPTKRRKKGKS